MGSYKDTEAKRKFPVVCVCGDSGNGKTTFARTLCGIILDGDAIRKYVTPYLSYSDEDRRKNNEVVANIATLLYMQGAKVIVSTVRADIAADYLKQKGIPVVLFKINKQHKLVKLYDSSNSNSL